MTTPSEHARRAQQALDSYSAPSLDAPPDSDTLTDLLADLMHWAKERLCSFDEALESAKRHFYAETRYPEHQFEGFTITQDEDGFSWREGGYFATLEECQQNIAKWNRTPPNGDPSPLDEETAALPPIPAR